MGDHGEKKAMYGLLLTIPLVIVLLGAFQQRWRVEETDEKPSMTQKENP